MEFQVTDTPDSFVVLELPDNEYKVFAAWNETYISGARWKLNSGISKIKTEDDHIYFIGYSGSCYKCNIKSNGIADSYCIGILKDILTKAKGLIRVLSPVELEILIKEKHKLAD